MGEAGSRKSLKIARLSLKPAVSEYALSKTERFDFTIFIYLNHSPITAKRFHNSC